MVFGCDSEWGKLRSVAMAAPTEFHMTPPINLTQEREYKAGPIDREKLLTEHQEVLNKLKENGIEVYAVSPRSDLPYLLNIRDPGVVIGSRLIQCVMARGIRAPEPLWVATQIISDDVAQERDLGTSDVKYEGGDVFLLDGRLIVGVSQRTNEKGLEDLWQRAATPDPPIAINLTPEVLHLDTVFNILPGCCIVSAKQILNLEVVIEELARRGITSVVEVSQAEADRMGTNFVSLDVNHILMADSAPELTEELRLRGIRVDTIPMDEHHRIGGSIRCMTMPLIRDATLHS
jgi:N-dimethylarginine dimethylaminohydrolase